MARHTRLIPSLAALSVSLTGCSDNQDSTEEITGSWTVTAAHGEVWPVDHSTELTATGGYYDGFAYGYGETRAGVLVVGASGQAGLSLNYSYWEVYTNPFYGSNNESESCSYSLGGTSEYLSPRQYGIRFQSLSIVCVMSYGEDQYETEESIEEALNLDCVLHPQEDVLDCIERIDGGFWAFERSTDK